MTDATTIVGVDSVEASQMLSSDCPESTMIPPPLYGDIVDIGGGDRRVKQQQQQRNQCYVAVPNEFTPILIPQGSKVVIVDEYALRLRRGFLFGVVLVLMAFYFLSRPVSKSHDGLPGVNPANEFEPVTQCLPNEASVAIYPDLGKVEVPSSASTLIVDVKGVGVGIVQVELDSAITQITVENHFHLTPNILPQLVNVSYVERSGRHRFVVETPHCLGDGCRDHRDEPRDRPHPGKNVRQEVDRDRRRYYNNNGCIVVASRIRIPASLAARATLPDLFISGDMISIEAVLADEPLAKTSRVRLTTLVGSIRAGGFTAAIFAAKSEAGAVLINAVDAPSIDLRSTTGSLTAKDISSKEFSSFSSAGSIHLENVTAERVDSESMAGTIIVTTVNVRSLALLSSSGSVRVKDAVVADTASLVSGSGSISADGFSGRFKYLTGKTRAGSVHVSNLLMDPAIPSNVEVESSSGSVAVEATDFLGKFLIKSDFGSVSVSGSHLTLDRTKSQINGTRGYGDDFIHGLAAVTVVGSTRAAFL